MPIHIDDVQASVEVDAGETGGEATGGTEPSPPAQQRWEDTAHRLDHLARRTAAWGFDD